jgi:hypothetical protein
MRRMWGNPLVTGIAQTASIHAGCRLRFDANKLLYVWKPVVPPSAASDQSTPMTNPNVAGARPGVFTT